MYFEGNLVAVEPASKTHTDKRAATGHIDYWDGTKALHAQYPKATVVWFWRLGD